MPRWTWKCNQCKHEEDRFVPLREREMAYACEACGGTTERLFSRESALNFMPFEPYYDEGLGCDVNGRREKRQIMADMGVQEAGDAKGGARNFDTKAPYIIGKSRPRGDKYQSKRDEPEVATWVGSEKGGKTSWYRSTDLKTV